MLFIEEPQRMLIDAIYAYDDLTKDPALGQKLSVSALLTALVAIPVIGLIPLAMLLGYQLDLIRNVRGDQHPPLPHWRQYGAWMGTGAEIMGAWLVYNLINALWLCTASALWFGNPGNTLVLICCTLPFLAVYNLFAIPLYTLGMLRYMDDPRRSVGSFFQFGALWDTLRQNITPLLQWWLFSTLVNLTCLFIPCVGWIVFAAIGFPLNGHMLGQLAGALRGSNPARAARTRR